MKHKINKQSPKFRKAFSMLELIFVIVILAILGKFGVEFLAQAYNTFIFSSINSRLQANSASAVEFISTRLQHRIKESVIARDPSMSHATNYELLSSAGGSQYTILEWVGSDIDGFRGNSVALPHPPNWSGVVDFNLGNNLTIVSPMTNTGRINTLIDLLSYGDSGINNAALFFVGSDTYRDGYGWDGATITDQSEVMHPITSTANPNEFAPNAITTGVIGPFTDITEYYKLAWTAYAVVHNVNTGELWLHYDYQPWNGMTYNNGKSELIMEDVNTFRFMSIGSLIKIQVCVESDLKEEYSICKEKTIY